MLCRLLFIYNHLSLLCVGLKQSFIKRTFAGHLPIVWSGAVLGSSYSLCRGCAWACPVRLRVGRFSICRARRRGPGERRVFWAGCLRVVRTTAPEEFFIICQMKGLYSPSPSAHSQHRPELSGGLLQVTGSSQLAAGSQQVWRRSLGHGQGRGDVTWLHRATRESLVCPSPRSPPPHHPPYRPPTVSSKCQLFYFHFFPKDRRKKSDKKLEKQRVR